MSSSEVGMIIRTNLGAPDIILPPGQLMDLNIQEVVQKFADSNSDNYIQSEYLQTRYVTN